MGVSRQEYWSGLPFPSPGDLPNLGIKPGSHALEADALTSEPPGKCLLRPAHFLIGLFFILSYMSCLYILETNPLSVASFAVHHIGLQGLCAGLLSLFCLLSLVIFHSLTHSSIYPPVHCSSQTQSLRAGKNSEMNKALTSILFFGCWRYNITHSFLENCFWLWVPFPPPILSLGLFSHTAVPTFSRHLQTQWLHVCCYFTCPPSRIWYSWSPSFFEGVWFLL